MSNPDKAYATKEYVQACLADVDRRLSELFDRYEILDEHVNKVGKKTDYLQSKLDEAVETLTASLEDLQIDPKGRPTDPARGGPRWFDSRGRSKLVCEGDILSLTTYDERGYSIIDPKATELAKTAAPMFVRRANALRGVGNEEAIPALLEALEAHHHWLPTEVADAFDELYYVSP